MSKEKGVVVIDPKNKRDAKEKVNEIVANIIDAENSVEGEPQFDISELRLFVRKLFGVSQSTYDAATSRLTGRFTIKELRREIEKWLKEGY